MCLGGLGTGFYVDVSGTTLGFDEVVELVFKIFWGCVIMSSLGVLWQYSKIVSMLESGDVFLTVWVKVLTDIHME